MRFSRFSAQRTFLPMMLANLACPSFLILASSSAVLWACLPTFCSLEWYRLTISAIFEHGVVVGVVVLLAGACSAPCSGSCPQRPQRRRSRA